MVQRHNYNREWVEAEYSNRIKELPERIARTRKYKSYYKLEGDGYVIAAASWALQQDLQQCLNGIHLALQASLAQLKMVQHPGQLIQLKIGDDSYFETSDKKETDAVRPDDWLAALDLALILKDQHTLNYLVQYPPDKISLNLMPTEEYSYLLVQFWKAYYSGSSNAMSLLVKAYKATDPQKLKATDPDKVLMIDVPPLDVLSSILSAGEKEINTRLEEALKKHRKYCELNDNKDYIPYLISTKLLAIAGLAIANGFIITESSSYLPEYL